jgi:hypothetical protein
MKYELSFNTSHHQFYISDKESSRDTGDINFWTEEATRFRLALGDSILGIGLESYGRFKGELVLLEGRNDKVDYDQYDHIVEGGVNVKSGILQVLNCPDSRVELEVNVIPGKYRVRIYSLNLDSVIDESGDDYYRIEMWLDTDMKRIVLKQYTNID